MESCTKGEMSSHSILEASPKSRGEKATTIRIDFQRNTMKRHNSRDIQVLYWLAVIDSRTGRKCATLECLSTTTKMASFPFWVFGKPVMKSILTLSHFHSGIGKGLRVPAGLSCSALTQ